MADYIKREDMIDALHNHYEVNNAKQNSVMDECVMLAMRLPAADVVDVVHCKDCKCWASTLTDAERDELAADPDGDGVCDYWECDGLGPNDYCSCADMRGEKK